MRPTGKIDARARLWERRREDEDFGFIRLGLGVLPSNYRLNFEQKNFIDDDLIRKAENLRDTSYYVKNTPIVISLCQTNPATQSHSEIDDQDGFFDAIPTTHALGVTGDRVVTYPFVRFLLTHYLAFHAPMDAKLYVLGTNKQEWGWTLELPHCQDKEQTQFHCFVEQNPTPSSQQYGTGTEDTGQAEFFLEGLRQTLAQRRLRLRHSENDKDSQTLKPPFLLIIIDLLDVIGNPDSPLYNLESDAAISILLQEGTRLGAAIIFLVPSRRKIPSGCHSMIELYYQTISGQKENPQLSFSYSEVGINSLHYNGRADYVSSLAEMYSLSAKFAELRVRESFGADISEKVPFLELMGYLTLAELEADAWLKWQTSCHQPHWLQVKLGLMSGSKPRTLEFSALKDGAHGMIAGTTGSGKSELLRSLILGLAVNYDPRMLNFVLVDYKGGGAFNDFSDLPHCVDVITNLDKSGSDRMFTAIESEIERREALNTKENVDDILQYRGKMIEKDRENEIYPFLFIIIDEFAEMITGEPEYRKQLEQITRVGRSVGVSLILAAQRPTGVTDQMRANVRLRICLRVESEEESREMLRRNDAYFLPKTLAGRAYLQTGNEEIDLIQVSYAGGEYIEPGANQSSHNQVPQKLFRAIIDQLKTLAEEQGLEKQQAPWPKLLPNNLSLVAPLISNRPDQESSPITTSRYLQKTDRILMGQELGTFSLNPALSHWLRNEAGWVTELDWSKFAMRPVIGLIDDPANARQLPLVVNLPRNNIAIFGAPGWGKTTFMQTLVISLAATHAPNQVHIYVLDFGGRNLNRLTALPQVGDVMTPDNEGYEEQVAQLFREMEIIVDDRKQKFDGLGVNVESLYHYNQIIQQKQLENQDDLADKEPLPANLIVIDNFADFKEIFENESSKDETVFEKFTYLARIGQAFGIHFAISATQSNVLPNKLANLFTERIALKLTDPTEYRNILHAQVPGIGDIPGRGYINQGQKPLSCQIAHLNELT